VRKQRGGCDRLPPSSGSTQVETTQSKSFRAAIGASGETVVEVAL